MSKGELCGLLGVSRQAHYQYQLQRFEDQAIEDLILEFVKRIRVNQPKVGGRKLYKHLEVFLQSSRIKMGRDALFDLLRKYDMLTRRRRKRPKTTDSNHYYRRYPNRIRNKIAESPHEILVSDLTYVETAEGFVYLFLITDAYSRKIVGFKVSDTMEALWAIAALQMAIDQLPEEHRLIHHSDRGSQYACPGYTDLLNSRGIEISMTENSNPLENCMAERVNGLVKELFPGNFESKLQAAIKIPEIIRIYNEERLHGSIGMITPNEAHQMKGPLKNAWKKEPAIASV